MRVRATAVYLDWIDSLEDVVARARIQAQIDRLAHGNPGKSRRLSGRLFELKMDFGPGYRVYYAAARGELVLLCGGDKSSQGSDIRAALTLLKHL